MSDNREEVVERVVTAGGVKDAGVLAARHGEEALEALQGWGQGRQVGLGWLYWSMVQTVKSPNGLFGKICHR